MERNDKGHEVLAVRDLTDSTYILRFERKGLVFRPGQYVNVGPVGSIHQREYSIYSPQEAPWLEILVREVADGFISKRLRELKPGDRVAVEGPFGFFRADEAPTGARLLFLATGTGISPFHCFVGSYTDLDFTLVHGVRQAEELYEHEAFGDGRVVSCLSRDEGGDYRGRLTDWLREHPADPDSYAFLCGNCDMVYEAFDLLKEQGVAPDRLFAEVYF